MRHYTKSNLSIDFVWQISQVQKPINNIVCFMGFSFFFLVVSLVV